MAGHSKWANIQHRKGAQDKKRGKIFSKLAKEVTVAAKVGGDPDPDKNPRLRLAIQNARKENMPNDNIKRAIDRAFSSADGDEYEEIRYEGYGPKSIAVIVEALTDNRNRTASDVRTIFTKMGGSLGETNSVAFGFNHIGIIEYKKETASPEEMLEAGIEAGAEDVKQEDDMHVILTAMDDLHSVSSFLEKKFGDPEKAELDWDAQNKISIDNKEDALKVLNFIEALEDNDDVQKVFTNLDLSDDVLKELNDE